MKRVTLIIIAVVLMFTGYGFPNSAPRLLRVEQAPGWAKGKPELYLLLSDLQNILNQATLEPSKEEIHVRIFNPEGEKIFKLGHLKKGKLKWYFKTVEKKYLRVKSERSHADRLWQEVDKKQPKSRYQLLLTSNRPDSDNVSIIKQYRLSFHPHLDLNAVMTYPLAAAPGSRLKRKVTVTIYNEGNIPAENFFIEAVLSGDNQFPMEPAVYSRTYREDVLLKDGRMLVELLKPGHSITMTFDGAMTIPRDTPVGKYHLGLVIDPENRITEQEESNNRIARVIIITATPDKILSNIDSAPVVIPQKKK